MKWGSVSMSNPLASLQRWSLERDDSGPLRIYRCPKGTVYHSVTSILKATSDSTALERWESWLGAEAAATARRVAATRGTQAHNQTEYLLKTARRLAYRAAAKRHSITSYPNGLERIPTSLTRWALTQVLPSVPRVSWSASGYARSLSTWVAANISAIHAVEFSVYHPAGFAGTSDGLVCFSPSALEQHGLDPALTTEPFIADWKTSASRRTGAALTDYRLQAGAYSLGLEHLTGIRCAGAAIVVARRVGPPDITFLDPTALAIAQDRFLDRCTAFHAALP